jgi:uncharacterized 2Fe-2S/4Fe-4S cluster protein (DUF4445 family)
LLEVPAGKVVPAGNTSLRGIKMALLCPSRRAERLADILRRTEHIGLAEDPRFQDTFLDCLSLAR